MLTADRLDALMQQEIDGANTPEETAELAAALRDDSEARARLEELRATAAALEAGREAEAAPAGLHEAVLGALGMSTYRVPAPPWRRMGLARTARRPDGGPAAGRFDRRSPEGSRGRGFGRGAGRGVGGFSLEREGRNMAGKSKAFIAGGFVVGLGLIAYLAVVRPPSNGDVSGTIGAAKKYRSEQIAAPDVVLGDQGTQQVLQSAEFHRIMADPDARKVLGSPEFARAVSSPEFAKVMGSPELTQALASPEFAKVIGSPDFAKVMQAPELAKVMQSPELSQMLASPEIAQGRGQSAEHSKTLMTTSVWSQRQISIVGYGKTLASPELARAIANPDFTRAVANPDFAKVMAIPELGRVMANPDLAKALANPEFGQIMAAPELTRAIANPDFARIVSNPGFGQVMASPDFAKAMESPELGKTATTEN